MSELPGTWFDGRNSRARRVNLVLDEKRVLRIESEEGDTEHPIAEVRISPRLGRTPRVLRLPGGGHVECTDSPMLDDWFAPPSRIEAAADWLERRRGPALAAAALTVAGVAAFFQFGLPWAASKAAPRIPAAVERVMSTQVLGLLDRIELDASRLPLARQVELQGKFRALTSDLPRRQDMQLKFRRAGKIGANAFALPDGTVVMTDQLVALAKNDEELVAVLAHETGHHEHRHALRQALESSGILVVTTLLFGDISGSSLTVTLPTVLLETGFSRGHEREADEFAFALLKRKGHSPKAFAGMMRRLSKAEAGEDDVVAYFSTHPASGQRIRRAEQAATSR